MLSATLSPTWPHFWHRSESHSTLSRPRTVTFVQCVNNSLSASSVSRSRLVVPYRSNQRDVSSQPVAVSSTTSWLRLQLRSEENSAHMTKLLDRFCGYRRPLIDAFTCVTISPVLTVKLNQFNQRRIFKIAEILQFLEAYLITSSKCPTLYHLSIIGDQLNAPHVAEE